MVGFSDLADKFNCESSGLTHSDRSPEGVPQGLLPCGVPYFGWPTSLRAWLVAILWSLTLSVAPSLCAWNVQVLAVGVFGFVGAVYCPIDHSIA